MRTFPVTVHRPVTDLDDYGNTRHAKDAQGQPRYTDHTQACYWVGPVRSQEYTEGRQTMTTLARASFPPGADVEETDELTAVGHRYRVTGVLRQLRPSTLKEWQVTVDLERAE